MTSPGDSQSARRQEAASLEELGLEPALMQNAGVAGAALTAEPKLAP